MDLGDIGWGSVDWIGLAQGRNKWRALVNAECTFGFLNAGKLLSGYTAGSPRIVLSSMELVSLVIC
jgi:hypothetical protein